jgi:ASCH domain
VKALSIRQPWTAMIVHGQKRIENRSRRTKHRGLIALHASGRDRWDFGGQTSDVVDAEWRRLGWEGRPDRDSRHITHGAVLGIAEIVDVCGQSRCDCGEWAATFQMHWRLANVRPLAEPVPCKGALGLWTLPDDVEASVVAQLGSR